MTVARQTAGIPSPDVGGSKPDAAGGPAIVSENERPRTAQTLPSVTLPQGGGAIRGMGEKVAVNPVNGTGAITVPVAVSSGRAGFTPQLMLSYDSGSGNGPFGFGWNLSMPSIRRKTDKGLPRYDDAAESDVFILSGAEDLVPILDETGERTHAMRTVHGVTYLIMTYRPRIEGLFARIERWVCLDTGISHWRSITRDNVTTLYGFEPDSRIADPEDPRRIFEYLICRTWDDKGNISTYSYAADDGRLIDLTQNHERNRTERVRATQRYLKEIRYGGTEPYFPTWGADGAETPLPRNWHFHVVFDHGDHCADAPTLLPDRPWPARPDPYSTYRAGFEVRTYRRVHRVLMFHDFPQEESCGAEYLVSSTDLLYSDQVALADPHNPIYTMLATVTHRGYRRDGGKHIGRSLPPLEFEYSQPEIQRQVLSLDADSLANLPQGVDGLAYRWVDLDGEGLDGILTDLGDALTYKRNLSPLNQVTQADGTRATRARFGPMETLPAVPSRSALTGQQLIDLDGSGHLDLVQLVDPAPGFFQRADNTWDRFRTFDSLPNVAWDDPNLRFVDLTGDGLADVLVTQDELFAVYPSLGNRGFGSAELSHAPWDQERGARVVLDDGTQTIFLADMSGDGLHDLVRVRRGDVSYWPSLGYGRFGRRVSMDRAPRFTDQERFDPARVRLADVDGTGTADLLYIGASGVQVCFNQSGNAWSQPNVIAAFPSADNLSDVQVTDLLGSGTACLVWSSPLPAAGAKPMHYVDLMGGRKAHMLVSSRNNLGAETRLTYAPSTRFYLADREAGRPWVTRLPFVVHVVERVETLDWIGRNRQVTRHAYHHGYFDGCEREFRGFGMVEQWDTEEFRSDTSFPDGETSNWDSRSFSPPVLTRTWFHIGALDESGTLSRQYAHQYWTEPALRDPARISDRARLLLPDSVVETPGLDPYEMREARRALKGQALRTEVYALDGTATVEDPYGQPYTVTERNFTVRRLQSLGCNRHAVFDVHPREEVTYHYERKPADPRVSHDVTLEVDEFGNVKRAASIGYPRRAGAAPPEPALSQTFQDMLAYDQGRLHVLVTDHAYTNPLTDLARDVHRSPQPASTTAREITGVSLELGGSRFDFDTLDLLSARTDLAHLEYESIPASDVDGMGTPASTPSSRIVEESRVLYRSDDLTRLLPAGIVESLALPGETYRASLTPGLVSAIFGSLLPDPPGTLAEAGYVSLPGQKGFWTPSGRVFFSSGDHDSPDQELAAAREHFYLPRRALDPFGGITRIEHDGYDLLPAAATDPVGNVTSATSDYRVLQPSRVTDPNGNRGEIAFDVLGQVAGTAVMGKTSESLGDSLVGFVPDVDEATVIAHLADPLTDPGEILASATTRVVYDHDAYLRTRSDPQPAPPVIYTLARETHVSDLRPGETSRFQHAFAFSDGYGREIQRKTQAEPGPLVDGGPEVVSRWVGSGWTIYDNKVRPVRKYEPFFSSTSAFEFAARIGVSAAFFYDPPGRQVAALHPDNTWEKTVVDAWHQENWDRNDTVLVDDPRTDPHVGDHFRRLLGVEPFASWYRQRITGITGRPPVDQGAERDAALKAAAHAATPAMTHLDALGRICLSVQDNGPRGRYPTRTASDVEGKPLAVFDALGRHVVEYCLRTSDSPSPYLAGWDLAGQPLYEIGMDSGARRTLLNVAGKPSWHWDARGHAFRVVYDPAQRTSHRYVSSDSTTEILLERSIYGEAMTATNLCGRLFRQYDTAGLIINERYDYKGNLLMSTRQLALDYHRSPDWTPLHSLTDAEQLDAAAASLLSPVDRFQGITIYDALNRPIQIVTAHSSDMKPNVIRHLYNEASLLDGVDVWQQQLTAPTGLLDPDTADLHAITNIHYNSRRQRVSLAFGNGVVAGYAYDPLTFRLIRMSATRAAFPSDRARLQDLSYSYDPVGNITQMRDAADIQNVVYFRNMRVEPASNYNYDPIYRLVAAVGREHLGQTGGLLNAPHQVTDDDSFRMNQLMPGDCRAMGQYRETYSYDTVGNIITMAHKAASSGWTRRYSYAEPSRINPSECGNRLTATSLPGGVAAETSMAKYAHDTHGNMTQMPHLPHMAWDAQDRLSSTTAQVVNVGVPETTFYTYDAEGRRERKATDGPNGILRTHRTYLGDVELHRRFASDGSMTLEREMLHITDGSQTLCHIETRTKGTDSGSSRLVRYQHTNHLGSTILEVNDQAQIVTYEEYFPYGSSAYQASSSQVETPKRYRYTGQERDDETSLYYHGARLYAPWLGRWTSADPAGLSDGVNLYLYVRDNPVRNVDRRGTETTRAEKELFTKLLFSRRLWADNPAQFARVLIRNDEAEAVLSRFGYRGPASWVHAGDDTWRDMVPYAVKDFETALRNWERQGGSQYLATPVMGEGYQGTPLRNEIEAQTRLAQRFVTVNQAVTSNVLGAVGHAIGHWIGGDRGGALGAVVGAFLGDVGLTHGMGLQARAYYQGASSQAHGPATTEELYYRWHGTSEAPSRTALNGNQYAGFVNEELTTELLSQQGWSIVGTQVETTDIGGTWTRFLDVLAVDPKTSALQHLELKLNQSRYGGRQAAFDRRMAGYGAFLSIWPDQRPLRLDTTVVRTIRKRAD